MKSFKHISTLGIIVLLLVSCNRDDDFRVPTEMTFHTSDIDLFWNFYDQNDPFSLKPSDVQELYIANGSIGLQDYSGQKDLPGSLAAILKLEPYQKYYESVRENSLNIQSAIQVSNNAIAELSSIHSGMRYTDVYFLVGALSAGGRISRNGLLIAVEMFTKSPNTSTEKISEWLQTVTKTKDNLPSIIIHELIHFQQNFTPQNSGKISLLEQSILEGMADYISRFLLDGKPFVNAHLHDYGDAHENELWQQFSEGKDLRYADTEWLYTGANTDEGHPSDMGYYVGYKIIEAYASTFSNYKDAINAMLNASNYEAIFERSGYNGN